MGLEYRVKRIKCKEQIEQCERFFIDLLHVGQQAESTCIWLAWLCGK